MVLNLIIGKVYLAGLHGNMMKIQNNILHLFSKRQPDLNWDNEEVRQEHIK